jgi:hypothetical protein
MEDRNDRHHSKGRHWKEGFAIKKTLEGRLCHQEDIGFAMQDTNDRQHSNGQHGDWLCRGTVPTERERLCRGTVPTERERLCRGTVSTEREGSAEKQKDLPKYEGWFSKETPSL